MTRPSLPIKKSVITDAAAVLNAAQAIAKTGLSSVDGIFMEPEDCKYHQATISNKF